METIFNGKNVIVVDDNSDVCEMIEIALTTSLSLNVEIYNSSKLFIENLSKYSFENLDVIIIDLMMPDFDGFEVLRKLSEHEKLRVVPKIILSAYDDPENIKDALSYDGVLLFIQKPVNLEEFILHIKTLLKIKKYEDNCREIIKLLTMKKNIISEPTNNLTNNINKICELIESLQEDLKNNNSERLANDIKMLYDKKDNLIYLKELVSVITS